MAAACKGGGPRATTTATDVVNRRARRAAPRRALPARLRASRASTPLYAPAAMDFSLLSSKVKIRHLDRLSPPAFDMSLHAENRARLVAALRGGAAAPPPGSFVLLAGGASETRHDTDHEPLFRQESFFHWAFGVREPDWLGAISLDTGAATLFVPRLPPAYAVVMGRIKGPAEWAGIYAVESVEYVEDIARVLRAGVGAAGVLYTLHGQNTDSHNFCRPATFPGVEAFTTDQAALWPAAVELRVIKTPAEQAVLRYVGAVSSEAHIAVMQAVCEGMIEYQLESLFSHWCHFYGGCRHNSYTCICASGINSSVLHYGHAGEPNSRRLAAADMCLFDMGGEYACYGADITTSFPVSGKFSPSQRMVYEAVLAAVYAVEDALKPGVCWLDMHTLSYRCVFVCLACTRGCRPVNHPISHSLTPSSPPPHHHHLCPTRAQLHPHAPARRWAGAGGPGGRHGGQHWRCLHAPWPGALSGH